MQKYFNIFFLIISVIFFIVASGVLSSVILTEVKNKKDEMAQVTSASYSPLQILPPGVKPSASVQQNQQYSSKFEQKQLTGVDLKSCQSFSKTFNLQSGDIFAESVDMGKKIFSIMEGAEEYYLTISPKLEKTLDSYLNLLVESNSKLNIFISSLDLVKEDMKNFSCLGDNPSAQLLQYNTDVKVAVVALEDYKKSVKNLIIEIDSISSASSSSTKKNNSSDI